MALEKYFLIFLSVAGLASGQILLKMAVDNSSIKFHTFEFFRLFLNKYFIVSITLYFLSFVIWSYLLSKNPVSELYPFISLSFVIVPILSFVFLNEKIEANIILGSIIILFGLIVLKSDF